MKVRSHRHLAAAFSSPRAARFGCHLVVSVFVLAGLGAGYLMLRFPDGVRTHHSDPALLWLLADCFCVVVGAVALPALARSAAALRTLRVPMDLNSPGAQASLLATAALVVPAIGVQLAGLSASGSLVSQLLAVSVGLYYALLPAALVGPLCGAGSLLMLWPTAWSVWPDLPIEIHAAVSLAGGGLAIVLWRRAASGHRPLSGWGAPVFELMMRPWHDSLNRQNLSRVTDGVDLRRVGPRHPVDSIRIALGTRSTPRRSNRKTWQQLLFGIAMLVFGLLSVHVATRRGVPAIWPVCFVMIPLLSGVLSILVAMSAPWGDGGQSTRQTLALLSGLPRQRAGYRALIAARLRPLYCRYLPGAALAITITAVTKMVAPALAIESLVIVIIWVLAETAIVFDVFSRPEGSGGTASRASVLLASALCLLTTQLASIPAAALSLGVYVRAGAVIVVWLAWLALLAVVAARSWQRAKCLPNPYLAASDSRQPVASLTRRILTTRRQSA